MARRLGEGSGALCFQRVEMGQHVRDQGPAGKPGRRPGSGEGVDADRVMGGQCHEPEGGGQTFRLIQLALDGHRGRGVDQNANRHLVVRVEQLDQHLVQAGEDVIVDATEVVAGVIFAKVGEIDGAPVPLRTVLTAEATSESVSAVELEALQPRHE